MCPDVHALLRHVGMARLNSSGLPTPALREGFNRRMPDVLQPNWHAASSLIPDLHFEETRIAAKPKAAMQASWLASAWKLAVKLTTANLR